MEFWNFLGGEGFGTGFVVCIGIVGESAEPVDILALKVGFFANELLIVVIALGEGSGVVISLIGIDDSDTIAAHRDVAEQGMRIVAEFLFQGVDCLDVGWHFGA